MTQRPRLQLALDLTDLSDAVAAARAAAPAIDIIEAGTLLCLAEGMPAVRRLRGAHPEKTIVADIRIVRAGGKLAQIAFAGGADWVTVVGEAPDETIAAAAAVAAEHGGEVQIELPDAWTADQARAWRGLGIGQVILHNTAEVGAVGGSWAAATLDAVRRLTDFGFAVTVTGGIEPAAVARFAGVPVAIFIAGRAIAGAADPLAAARDMQTAIDRAYA